MDNFNSNSNRISEEDTRARYIDPSLANAGWSPSLIRREHNYTKGRINVREQKVFRDEAKRVDYLLFYSPSKTIAIVEAKDVNKEVSTGIQQAIGYAADLDTPFAYSTNGKGYREHDMITGAERDLGMDEFPTPDELWARYCEEKHLDVDSSKIVTTPYYFDINDGKEPRYYQRIAIDRTVEAVAMGQKRILLVMATGTGKTFTAFQIIHRLRQAGKAKRILYLADRNVLIDQTIDQDFKPFSRVITKVENHKLDSSYEIYMALYHQMKDTENDYYKQFKPNFFDLIIVDECHRSSARDDSNWHKILDYFSSATQIGMTATPKETEDVSNIAYFGDPIYTYSLKQGVDDGYLAPYEVIRVGINKDLEGYRPEAGKLDMDGYEVIDREYTVSDFDRTIVIDERTRVVAKRITEWLKANGRMSRAIVFCVDTEHALRMRNALAEENQDMMKVNPHYVVRITGDDKEGKDQLKNFINKNTDYPVIATTSMLLSTGVDSKMVKLIALDKEVTSMTEFKQIIGRGTRLVEEKGKNYFTIMDFRNNAKKFADPAFDGEAEKIIDIKPDEKIEVKPFRPPELQPVTPIIDLIPGKVHIDGVDVEISTEKTVYYTGDGKLISQTTEEFAKDKILKTFPDKDSFVNEWQSATNKKSVLEKINTRLTDALQEKYGSDYDIFDIILKVAYEMPIIKKLDRVTKIHNSDFYDNLEPAKKEVVDELINLYIESGVVDVEDRKALSTKRFQRFGGISGILRVLGSPSEYSRIISEIKTNLYS